VERREERGERRCGVDVRGGMLGIPGIPKGGGGTAPGRPREMLVERNCGERGRRRRRRRRRRREKTHLGSQRVVGEENPQLRLERHRPFARAWDFVRPDLRRHRRK
jgi:hypothetical protein